MESLKQEVRDYILGETFADREKIKDETLLFQEGFFDSMGFVSLLGFLEEKFGVAPSDDELVEENFESINAITNFVSKKQAA